MNEEQEKLIADRWIESFKIIVPILPPEYLDDIIHIVNIEKALRRSRQSDNSDMSEYYS
jgi:hypothetical protein